MPIEPNTTSSFSSGSTKKASHIDRGTPTILIVDDDDVVRDMLETQLTAAGYPVLTAKNGAQAMQIFRTQRVRIVLSDWTMPEVDGLELCRRIRAIPDTEFIYFIMLTMHDDTQKLVTAFDAGVNDFLAKPCEYAELIARLHAGRRMIELETTLIRRIRLTNRLNDRLHRLNGRLKHAACTDPLTGLLNRREAMARLRDHWRIAVRYERDLCVAMIDVDDFKMFNDTYGHQGGDELLRSIATSFTASLRDVDIIARVGGDEFLIVVPETNASGATVALDRVRQSIRSGSNGNATISIGLSSKSDGAESVEALLRSADQALYAAKNAGRNALRSSQ